MASQQGQVQDNTGDGPSPKKKRQLDNPPLIPSSVHVPPYIGMEHMLQNCAPPVEQFLYTQTPAGSELCSWMSDVPSCEELNSLSHSNFSRIDSDAELSCQDFYSRQRRRNALRALTLERQFINREREYNDESLILRFPDPMITAPMIASFSENIRNVIFPKCISPRYCLVNLTTNARAVDVMNELNKVRFGCGYLQAELKSHSEDDDLDNIDPCSLYVNNIPFNMSDAAIISYFSNACRVEIADLCVQQHGRSACVWYDNEEIAMSAFKNLVNTSLTNCKLKVRFCRLGIGKNSSVVAPEVEANYAINNVPNNDSQDDVTNDLSRCTMTTENTPQPPPPTDGKKKKEEIEISDSSDEDINRLRDEILDIKAVIDNLKLLLQDQGKYEATATYGLNLRSMENLLTKSSNTTMQQEPRDNQMVTTPCEVENTERDSEAVIESNCPCEIEGKTGENSDPCHCRNGQTENRYVSFMESSIESIAPPYRPTTEPIESSGCFSRLFKGFKRNKTDKSLCVNHQRKDKRLQLFSELDSTSDV